MKDSTNTRRIINERGVFLLEGELDLYKLWQSIVKRWYLFLLIPLFMAAASYVYCVNMVVPLYRASTTLLIKQQQPASQMILYQDVMLSRQLAQTYGEIARSATVLEKVAANLELPYGSSVLRGQVSVAPVRDTEIINISAVNPDPELARDIANEVARVFMKEIVNIYKVENVSIIDRAVTPPAPFSPQVQRSVSVAFMIGLVIAGGLTFLIEFLDKTIKTPEDIQERLQLPVLGIIPYIDKK